MGKFEKNEEDYYIFKPRGFGEAFCLFVHVKCYSLKDLIRRAPFYIKKGEIREIIDYEKWPKVEIACRTHCSDGVIYYPRKGVKSALGDDYETFVVMASWKEFVRKYFLGSKGEGRPFLMLFTLTGLSFLLCQAYRHWLFPFCSFAEGKDALLCQSPLVQYSIEASATSLMVLSWAIVFFILGFYFAFYVTKKEKYTYCVTKTRWAGLFFLAIGVGLSFRIGYDFLNEDKYKLSYALFHIARDPTSIDKPEYAEFRQTLKLKLENGEKN